MHWNVATGCKLPELRPDIGDRHPDAIRLIAPWYQHSLKRVGECMDKPCDITAPFVNVIPFRYGGATINDDNVADASGSKHCNVVIIALQIGVGTRRNMLNLHQTMYI